MPQVEEISDPEPEVQRPAAASTPVASGAAAAAEQPGSDGKGSNMEEPVECQAPTFVDGKAAADGDGSVSKDAKGVDGEQPDASFTPEQLKEREEKLEIARSLKAIGNQLFAEYDYQSALEKYTEAIEAAPEGHKEKAVFFNNRATCHFKLAQFNDVIKDCSAALKLDPDYSKCLLRRAQAYETEKKICEAFDDFQRALKLDPSNRIAQMGSQRLEKAAGEEREKQKEEMLGKLKDLGNSLLGNFGMSLDNFKAVQDPNTGSYSISFQQ
mmetsp:Transcript_51088/g.103908  ORF Transcript_51088/g.103908 Transcript_51088/m.103908 type:complete len:269 (+) Transcript_51088:69-875(+)